MPNRMGLDGERTGYLGKENMDERDGRKEEMCCTMPPVWRERETLSVCGSKYPLRY